MLHDTETGANFIWQKEHLKDADTGPGSTVLDEQPSYEQDSAHVIGHIIPTILCSNQ